MILILKHRNIDHTFICYTARQNKEASFTMLTISRVISATVILSVYWQQYVVLFLVIGCGFTQSAHIIMANQIE